MSESRLFQIIYHLLNKGEATASELAEKFEVSTRTIYRDIDKLSSAGIPIYTTAGYRGGIHLDESFVLKKSILSKEDMQNILIGLQSLSAVGFSESNTILAKLQALFEMNDANWMEVDYSRFGCDAKKERRLFALIKEAIQKKYRICFQYYNSKGEASVRECKPLKLIFKDRAWYLYAYCLKKNAGRIFRLSRIRELEVTNRHFEDIQDDDLSFLPPAADMIETELMFAKETAHRVYDIFDETMITAAEEYLIVKATMPKDEWLYSFLMSFGDRLTILSPMHLKDELKKRFKTAFEHFEN